ncbi:progestin and adipoQ receptor family member 3 [Galendromus occidentalis]|uniref:Progestin and adipoQ receptor family member 3 n=1 Tax=Galendromus occidentalis TaxID=34638 RepID=A0AAJ6QU67_9ACAR|nr:progestin and adipoQ receptor family member 3 [Galendromus occidentalis]
MEPASHRKQVARSDSSESQPESDGSTSENDASSRSDVKGSMSSLRCFPISLPGMPFATSATQLSPTRKKDRGSRLKIYEDIPKWLQNNHFIRDGYLVHCSASECIQSIWHWHNETLNIWTHLLGFFFLLGIFLYDVYFRLPLIGANSRDTWACILITGTYCFTLLLSSIYHTFKCMNKKMYYLLLKTDVVGIGMSLSATIMSGTYYGFHDNEFWQTFYLTCEIIILSIIYFVTFHPVMGQPQFEPQRNVVIASYVLFAMVPTAHWVMLNGLESPIIQFLLHRVVMVFVHAGVALVIFARRFPECLYPGTMDCIGASHQIWHLFVILAKLWWHETGFMFLQCHLQKSCDKDAFKSPVFW